jgi:gamma-glutamyltranspeptidase/glutathione hydrolase
MMPLRFLVTVLLLTSSTVLSAQHRSYGRSVVATPFGIVATSEVEASQAGARMLERGGSAIDAGIAANAVLGVMEPMMNGLGGDLFAILLRCQDG